MDDAEAMKILHPMCDIYQLWKPVTPVSTDTYVIAYELDSIHFSVVLDEFVDVTVIHPFRHQRKPGRLHVQLRAEQRDNVGVAQVPPCHGFSAEPL